MFDQIRNRLLISYLFVVAAVLASFAVALRILAIKSFNDISNAKLVSLGERAIANTKLENDRLILNENILDQDVLMRDRLIEWFDPQGKVIAKRGKEQFLLTEARNTSFYVDKNQKNLLENTQDLIPHQLKNQTSISNDIISVVLPIYRTGHNQPIGYLKVSQSSRELEANIRSLDWRLTIGFVLGLGLTTVSSIILTRQATAAIEVSFQRLKQFTADASHELRSPLMAIKANATVALKYADGMRKEDLEKFTAIANATDQIKQLTEDLLFLARNDNLPQIEKQKINVTAILEEIVQLYYPSFEAKNIALKVDIALSLTMLGHQGQIRRLFNNLIANALIYTTTGGEVNLKAQEMGHQLVTIIKDTGIGIASENLSLIFERFWRADSARSYHQGSSGLGLAIAQTILHNHQGSIQVNSELGKGSCFTVYLPTQP
ncbi:MAG: HAMP domain-containing sensor histidine kinase [Snowella sp.]|nr:HAMP domain-containing sensor histidine kinase [Snowella sp.]